MSNTVQTKSLEAFVDFVRRTGGQVIGVDLPGALKVAIEVAAEDMRERAAKEAAKGPAWLEVHGNTVTYSPDETEGLTLEARIRALPLSQ